MILSDDEIVEKKLIAEKFSEASLTPNGYDLRIEKVKYNNTECSLPVTIQGYFQVLTKEKVTLPNGICAKMYIRSSFAKRGTIGSFGYVDAGFSGQLILSFFSVAPIVLNPEERIAQIVFETSMHSGKLYSERSGNYQNQKAFNVEPRN